MVELLACNLATLAIAMTYYAWRDSRPKPARPADIHERVAYMLWVSAQRG